MNHSTDFFRDEIRNGFYVPTAVKQAWAATLDVLSEIDRICEKYGITYYADWGTFLGAVRHGGFIPWDDDLDICMRREDYVRFREVADMELPSHYDIHDFERHENHWLFLSRVVNNKKICFDPDYLNEHYNLPWLGGVNIFVKDKLYPDPVEEEKRDREILDILACADSYVDGKISRQVLVNRTEELARKYKISIPASASDREMAVSLYRLAEREMGRVKAEDSETIGQIFPWVLKGGPKVGEPSKYYEKVIRLPFEDTTIPVPSYYNKVLSRRYGNFNKIRKVWGGHDYPFYEAQKKEMMRLSGGDFPGFRFSPEMLKRPEIDKSGSLKTISAECLTGLEGFYNEALDRISCGDIDGLGEVFQNSQQLAVDFGTLIENVLGENRLCVKAVVGCLEKYCEEIFVANSSAGQGDPDLSGIRASLDEISEAVQKYITGRKEICFMPIGVKEWQAFTEEYRKACTLEDTDVYVVPLPLMTKDVYGNITMSDDEIISKCDPVLYKDIVNEEHLMDFTSYDPTLHCPDKIYIQDPYSGENPVLTVPDIFYAENLRKYTDELCFVFIGKTSEFGEEDVTDRYNLKNYVTVPGIVYSDKVYVQSENIKQQYIKALCEFAGEDTERVWAGKLEAVKAEEKNALIKESSEERKKHILFCLGANELSEKKDSLPEGLRDRLNLLVSTPDRIDLSIAFYPEDRNIWTKIDMALSEEIFAMIDKEIKDRNLETVSFDVRNTDETACRFDAYYGSPSPFVPAFITQGKPAMIADYSVK